MKKLYKVTLEECMAEQIMLSTEADGNCQSLVDKLAEVTPVIPSDCDEVTINLTADELYECFKQYQYVRF